MKVLFDTNVILDVLLDREPFAGASAAVLSRAEIGELTGICCATTVTTIFYLCCKAVGWQQANQYLSTLLTFLDISPVNRPVIENALLAEFNDFEDAVLHESARLVSAQVIVTRNKQDFAHSAMPVYTPEELLNLLAGHAL